MQTEMTNLLSRGNTAEIFDYSENKILKLFNKDYPELAINHEFENSKIIFNLGIKTPKAYEITDCSERKGIVYDKIEGTTVLQILLKLMKTAETDKSVISEINSYFEKFARFHKNFISKTTDNPNLMNYKDFLRIFARDKKDFIEKIDALPDGNNVLHGDFHPDNLMLGKDNELYLIDMMNVSKGPAEYDIARTYFLLGSNKQIQQDYLKLMETDFEKIKPFHEIISLLRNREMGLE